MKAKKVLFSILGMLLLLSTTQKASAYIYGGDGLKQILIDKTIQNPNNYEWVDNLDSSVVVFTADNLVNFKVRIKNSGDEPLANIKVIDTLPPYTIFISGPGEYNGDSHQLTWYIDRLEGSQESIYDIQVKVVPSGQLPQGGSVCLLNRAETWSETGEYDYDASQFCIETRILGVVITPETGFDPQLALQALGCLSLMGVGLRLRKYR